MILHSSNLSKSSSISTQCTFGTISALLICAFLLGISRHVRIDGPASSHLAVFWRRIFRDVFLCSLACQHMNHAVRPRRWIASHKLLHQASNYLLRFDAFLCLDAVLCLDASLGFDASLRFGAFLRFDPFLSCRSSPMR
jgi:hypothetical protein